MSAKRISVLILIIACCAVAFYSMRGMLTPYVAFSDAMETGDFVQVIGTLEKSAPVEHFEGYFTFTMKDSSGSSLKVRYEGAKPLNFEHAANVVALGSYNAGEKRFEAEKLLVKCPSKYQRKATL